MFALSPFKNQIGRVIQQNIALRAIEISMGFVFLMGAWRRFYNMPLKHDITSSAHLSNKLVMAAPGSPIESTIHWLLYQPFLSEWSVYLMSFAEGVVGITLMLGLFTRLAALGSAMINICLMLIFGWMGFECLDEWTMAGLGFAISISCMIAGPSGFSLDSYFNIDILAKYMSRQTGFMLTLIAMTFTIGFYSYYFGIFNFKKLTSTSQYHISAEKTNTDDIWTLYVDAGGSSSPAYIDKVTFTMNNNQTKTIEAKEIEVTRNHFAPWDHKSGTLTSNDMMIMSLGAKVDIKIPTNAISADIHIIHNKSLNVVHF